HVVSPVACPVSDEHRACGATDDFALMGSDEQDVAYGYGFSCRAGNTAGSEDRGGIRDGKAVYRDREMSRPPTGGCRADDCRMDVSTATEILTLFPPPW